MTALDVITAAMLRINAIAPGENPTDGEAETGLNNLNDMMDAWQAERLMIYSIQRQVFTLNSGQQSYTVGPGGDIDIPRPPTINRMGIINLSNAAQPLELPLQMLTDTQWQLTPVKQIYSTLPQLVYDDGGYPWRTLYLWCIPSVSVGLALYIPALLGAFIDLATDYEFPPGYADAIKWNLAVRIAPEFGGFMPPTLPALALEAKARVKSINTPSLDLRCDEALVGRGRPHWNWLTDTPTGTR